MKRVLTGLLLLSAACGGASAPPNVPTQPTGPTPTTGGAAVDVWVVPEGPREDDVAAPGPGPIQLGAWKAASAAKVVPAPESCKPWATRAGVPGSDLAAALTEADAAKRDARLAGVGKTANKGMLVAALRADLAPIECADVITDPEIGKMKDGAGAIAHTLVGLSLASKLARTAASPPTMAAETDKEKVKAFIKGPLATWMVAEAKAIESLSAGASGLQGYGRGLAALEAGVADLRLVDKIRSAPTPASWDAELKQVYEAALDEALEPRKRRGRDAALVGLGDFAREGVIEDPRVRRARQMISKLYGGRRIDALDGLLLPPLTPTAGPSAFWMNTVPEVATDLTRGYPQNARVKTRLDPKTGASADARARLDLGRLYWRKVDFVEAAQIAHHGKNPADRLVLAVALALAHGGTKSAADMMSASTPAKLELSRTAALDALAAEGGPLSGMAAFDAAHLRALSPPEGDASAYFKDVAARFRKAAQLLSGEAKQLAESRAGDAETAAKIGHPDGPPGGGGS